MGSIENKNHIVHLDGLRGIAVLLVISIHFFPYLSITRIGWMGVELFFVLSGFLITKILLRSKSRKNYFRNFYMKRMLRIFPLYYLVLFLFFFIYPILKEPTPEIQVLISNQIWFWSYLQNWYYSFSGWHESPILNHLWSLAIEEQYYLFWPVVVFLVNDKKLIGICILLFLSSMIFRNLQLGLPFSYMNTFTRLEGLSFGSAIGIYYSSRSLNSKRLDLLLPLLLVLAFIAYNKLSYINLTHIETIKYGYTLTSIIFGLLLLMSFQKNVIGKYYRVILSNPFLLFTGKISYGLYIYHIFIYVFFFKSLQNFFSPLVQNNLLINLASSMVLIFLTYLISTGSYYLYESPFLKLKERYNS